MIKTELKTIVNPLPAVSLGIDRRKSCGSSRPRIRDTVIAKRIPRVVTFTPPAQDPGAAPMNMRNIITKQMNFVIVVNNHTNASILYKLERMTEDNSHQKYDQFILRGNTEPDMTWNSFNEFKQFCITGPMNGYTIEINKTT